MLLNLGLNVVNKGNPNISEEDEMFVFGEAMSLMDEFKDLSKCYENLVEVTDTLYKYGYSPAIGDLINVSELDDILKINVKNATHDELKLVISSEDFGDALTDIVAKINNTFGKMGDSINNFFKTTLPFKEKYIKKIFNYRKELKGKRIDAEKFGNYKVPGTKKTQWREMIQTRKTILKAMIDVTRVVGNVTTMDALLEKVDRYPDIKRFGGWVNWYKPWTYRAFGRKQIKTLGWSPSDVDGVLNDTLEDAESLHKFFAGNFAQFAANRFNTTRKISILRATGKKEEAIELRKDVSKANAFFLHYYGIVIAFVELMRKLLYFANSMGYAASKSIKE